MMNTMFAGILGGWEIILILAVVLLKASRDVIDKS